MVILSVEFEKKQCLSQDNPGKAFNLKCGFKLILKSDLNPCRTNG